MPCRRITPQEHIDLFRANPNAEGYATVAECACCDCGLNTTFEQNIYEQNNAQYGLPYNGIGWYYSESILGMGGAEPPRGYTGAYDGYTNTWITGGTEFDWSYVNGTKPVNSFWVSHTREYAERLRLYAGGSSVDRYSNSYEYRLYQCVDDALTDITSAAVVQQSKKHYCINVNPDYPYLEGARPPSIVNTIDLGTALDYAFTRDPGPALYNGYFGFVYPLKMWCGGYVNSDGSSAGACETEPAPNNCAKNIPTGEFIAGNYSGPSLTLSPGLFANCT